MSKTTKGIIAVVATLAIVGGIYMLTHDKKIRYARNIAKFTGTGYMSYLTMDEDYLKARANALRKGASEFSYKDEKYSSETGKKIV